MSGLGDAALCSPAPAVWRLLRLSMPTERIERDSSRWANQKQPWPIRATIASVCLVLLALWLRWHGQASPAHTGCVTASKIRQLEAGLYESLDKSLAPLRAENAALRAHLSQQPHTVTAPAASQQPRTATASAAASGPVAAVPAVPVPAVRGLSGSTATAAQATAAQATAARPVAAARPDAATVAPALCGEGEGAVLVQGHVRWKNRHRRFVQRFATLWRTQLVTQLVLCKPKRGTVPEVPVTSCSSSRLGG